VAAAHAKMQRFTHTSFQVLGYEPYVALAEKLNSLAPGDQPKKTLLLTTGAEAVENAVKIARVATRRRGVIAFTGGFHGRTQLTMGLTGKVLPYKAAMGPFPAEIFHAPFPMATHGVTPQQSLAVLNGIFKGDIAADETAAIIIEPVTGEDGFYAAPTDFLRSLRDICDRSGILLIADEIQTGFGRTGKMFAIEHNGVVPELITVAKSLADGYPLSGIIGRAEIMDAVPPGGLGGTYGGNPVACAAALAVIDAIEAERLLDRSTEMGRFLVNRLQRLAAREDLRCIGEVRGIGAMVVFELVSDVDGRTPDPDLAKALTAKCLESGLIVLSCGLYGNVIRILAPLTASDAILEEGPAAIERSLSTLARKTAA
jgi:4-aminobutyrate aminotransferase apoenzyme (EC 2.6.1.19)